jgi:hypothetical protein
MAIFLAASLGTGYFFLWRIGVDEWLSYRRSDAWRATPARIVAITPGKRTRFVTYEYEWSGTTHRSVREVFGATGARADHVFPRDVKAGDAVTVYVDPDRPWRAVAGRRLGSGFWVGPVFGLVLVTAGLAVVWAVWRASAAEIRAGR